MGVAVVQVRVVGVAVDQPLVPMAVAVRLTRRVARRMRVTMVRVVVRVTVLVLQRLVGVVVLVPLGEVEPEADSHQAAGGHEAGGQGLGEAQNGQDRADEGGERKIGAGARGAEMAERCHVEGEAEPIAEEADDAGRGDRARARQAGAEAKGERRD